jgi:Fungal Zn(2)-Cys(6) binuclear cluster domain/Zinc finger, C2H2 type
MSKVVASYTYSQQNACSRPDFMTMRLGANIHEQSNQHSNSILNEVAQPQPPSQPQPQPLHQDHEKSTNTSSEGPGQDQGFYQCSTCKKTYNRADHLIRHVRSHTHEKPYVCETCGKGFARPDLLKRHASGHEDEEKGPTQGSASKKRKLATNYNLSQSSRVTQACKQCASSKLKCSEGKPCERCKKKNLACDESSPDANSRPADDEEVINGFHTQSGNYSSASKAEQHVFHGNHGEISDQSSNHTPNSALAADLTVANGVLEFNGTYFPEFLRNVVAEPGSSRPTARSDPSGLSQSFFPQNYVGPGSADDGDFGWAAELWYSDNLQDAFNMPFESTFTPYAPTMSTSSENASLAGVGADAFKGSLIGSWTPQPEDSSMMERQNLVAPKNVDSMSLFTENKKKLLEPLSLHARDRILGMVLETCPHAASSRIIASFPSADFLNNCIQYYFCRRHEEQIDSYIHLPTLKPNEERAELLAMLAGAGAVCTASGVVRKLGYALQESVRHAVQKRVGTSPTCSITCC